MTMSGNRTKSETPAVPSKYFSEGKRRPRFRKTEGRRSETSRAGLYTLTPRDIDIIASVGEFRFLNSDQICRLHGEGRVRARLTEIFHQGYIERPIQQRDLKIKNGVLQPGSIPVVYGLARRGAELLVGYNRLPASASKRNWARDNADASRLYIGHTLAIADMKIALTVSTREGGVVLQRAGELERTIARDYQKYPGRPFSMKPTVIMDGVRYDVVVDCDLAFALDDTVERRRSHWLVEIDMDTMPIVRRRRDGAVALKGTSMMRKFLAYDAAHTQGLHKTMFDWPTFRVLVITSNATHAKNMATEVARMNGGKGSKLFWFADNSACRGGDIMQFEFFDCLGNRKTLTA
jgi:hypothetical protein